MRVQCRDLRTRNFNTRFGQLDLAVDSDGNIQDTEWHV